MAVTFLTDKDPVLRYDEQTLTEEQKAQARENIGLFGVEPAEDDIPKVFFGRGLPQTKDDTIMSFRYISKTEDIKCYCKTKAQGSGSLKYPKKNQTVKLYKDADCTEKLNVDFKGWGKQNKFCFKANWIDLSHARNIVSARLWGEVVKDRANYTEIPELLRTSPNQGAVDGFPVKVYAGGTYQGRYTLNIPKDAWMTNMDDSLDTHCILCGENSDAHKSSCFMAPALFDGTDWTDELHDAVPEAIKTRWNEAISFVVDSKDEEFVAGIGDYFNVPSLIDYYLFGLICAHHDGFRKNQLYMTYDGLKWYASMYDLDSTWGMHWDGTTSIPYDGTSYLTREHNLLYYRLFTLFIDEIRTRWNELKTSVLSLENILNHFERFIGVCPPWLVTEDFATTTARGMFTEIPSKDTNNIQQIRDFVADRLVFADAYISEILHPLTDGTHTFSNDSCVTVSRGYRVKLTTINGGEHAVTISDPSKNSSVPNSSSANATGKGTIFEVNNGDIIKTIVRNHTGVYPKLRFATSNEHGSNIFTDIYLPSDGQTGSATVTIDKDMKIGAIYMYFWLSDNTPVEFDLEIYVNGVRYV